MNISAKFDSYLFCGFRKKDENVKFPLGPMAANDNPVTNEKRWGMLVDTNKLTESNINDMVNACQEENGCYTKLQAIRLASSPLTAKKNLKPRNYKLS